LKIDQIASDQEGVAAEEALILRGPQPGQLNVYKDALERLNASIAFKSSDRDSLDTARLVETGAKKLTSLYTKLVAECSSGSTPGPTTALSPVSISSELMNTLQPLVAFLRTLPQPSTHPSHPAASSIFNTLREAQKGYADMRGNWVKRCLEGQGKRVLDRADTIDVVLSGKEFGDWVRSLLDFAEVAFSPYALHFHHITHWCFLGRARESLGPGPTLVLSNHRANLPDPLNTASHPLCYQPLKPHISHQAFAPKIQFPGSQCLRCSLISTTSF
jgi:hypothetical protein